MAPNGEDLANRVRRFAGDADEIDTVSVSLSVGQIVSQVSPIHRNSFSVAKATHVLPYGLFVSEAWPSVRAAFLDKVIPRTATWSNEQWFSGVRVVECNLLLVVVLFRRLLQELGRLEVPRMFRPVAIVVADPVGCLSIDPPPQILLNRNSRRSMGFCAPEQ